MSLSATLYRSADYLKSKTNQSKWCFDVIVAVDERSGDRSVALIEASEFQLHARPSYVGQTLMIERAEWQLLLLLLLLLVPILRELHHCAAEYKRIY